MKQIAIQFCELFIELLHFMILNLQTYNSNLQNFKSMYCMWC